MPWPREPHKDRLYHQLYCLNEELKAIDEAAYRTDQRRRWKLFHKIKRIEAELMQLDLPIWAGRMS